MSLSICPDCGQYMTACQGSHVLVTLYEDTCINGVLYRAGSSRLMPALPAQNQVQDITASSGGGAVAQPTDTGDTSGTVAAPAVITDAGSDGASSTDTTVQTTGLAQVGGTP